jgi:hypothetical protein
MIRPTATRVHENTPEHIKEAIRHRTIETIGYHLDVGGGGIERRLAELDHEWDLDRTMEIVGGGAALLGLTLGATASRKWLLLPALVGGFMLQYAIQGWSPAVAIGRRFGFRTPREIEHERYALKAVRGDFDKLALLPGAGDRAAIQRMEDEGGPPADVETIEPVAETTIIQVVEAVGL